ncbi:stability/partitioning determinant [Cupriavidus malaysiensis]|uniref:stability/partitioning determinant n=1 Tax=Cupriavidus malaysiensis TaxID=367825 RepID=UPI0012FFC549|nr:stability/partitioning determinant [Cupriavidus malaysiensis]
MTAPTQRANPLAAVLEDFQEETPRERSNRPDRSAVAAAAKENGFVSRDPSKLTAPARTSAADSAPIRKRRTYITGRNKQFNIKATEQTIETFRDLADKLGLSSAETFELAVRALAAQHGA